MLKVSLYTILLFLPALLWGQEVRLRNTYFQCLKHFEFEKAKKIAQQEPDQWNQRALELLSQLLYESGQLPETSMREDSIEIGSLERFFEEESSQQMLVELLWGYYSFYSNPYTVRPIQHFSRAYQLSQEFGTSEEMKFCVYSILKIYNWEFSQSNNDIQAYLNIYEELLEDPADEFHFRMSKFVYELRDIHFQLDIGDEFIRTFDSLMLSFHEDHHFWTEYYITLGIFRRYFARQDEAEELFLLALARMKEQPYLRYLKFRLFIQLAEISRERGNFEQAIDYISDAKLNRYLNDSIRAWHYLNRYAAANWYGLGQLDSAYHALSRADTLQKQLDYQVNSLKIARYNWQFQTEEKEKALIRNRNWLIILLVIFVVVSIMYFLLQISSRRKRLLAVQEKNMQKTKVASLLKEQELIALNSMIEGQETERKRIAEDLHDRLGSTLSAVKMHMDVLSDNDSRYVKLNSIIGKAVDDTREIAHGLMSGVLSKFGLLAALQDLKETIESSDQFQIQLSTIQFEERLDPEFELHIYRILQELVTNTLKHAYASEVRIQVERKGQDLRISYEDDGIGFDSEKNTSGMGLKNIESRIEKIEGKWSRDSSPNEGMRVYIDLKI